MQDNVAYLYVDWLRARAILVDDLAKYSTDPRKTREVVDTFFKKYCFELGLNISTSLPMVKKMSSEELKKMNRQRAAHKLADEIMNSGCFMHTFCTIDDHQETYTYRVLVFARPERVTTATSPDTCGTQKRGRE